MNDTGKHKAEAATTPAPGKGSGASVTAILVPGRAGEHLVRAVRGSELLNRDTFNLNKGTAREKFVRESVRVAGAKAAGGLSREDAVALKNDITAQLLRFAEVPPGPGDAGAAAEELPEDITESGYAAIDGSTYHVQGNGKTKLANFVARIIGETVHSDGVEETRMLGIRVEQRGRPDVTVEVPVEQFNALEWVMRLLGPRYCVQAGVGVKDRLRAAVQELSGREDLPTSVLRHHAGWVEAGGKWYFLHAGGAVGPDHSTPPFSVRLDGPAAGFHLPEPPTGRELRDAVRASLRVADGKLVPDAVGLALLATVYRAPLCPADYALWLAGRTGVHKSELAALAQQHSGAAMTRDRLPGSWMSTENALELLAFTVKDAVLVIDDFAPPASRQDVDRLHRAAERLVRGQGNSAGRARMRPDGTPRPPKPPRGLILGTGEDLPRGHSIMARLWALEMEPGTVNLKLLTACQRDAAAGLYAGAMAGYLAWLAPQYAEVRATIAAERVQISDRAVANVVQRSLVAAGRSARGFAAHSLCAGLITQAAMAGVSERAIQDQSGHKSLAVMRRYIRDGSLFRENAAAKVGLWESAFQR